MKRLTVLIDIDDTIENLCEAWCKWLNKKHGLNVSPEKITDWDISRFFSDLTSEEIFSPLLSEDFWETVTPKPDAVKYLSALHSEGFNLFLCSATDYRVVRTKYEKIISKYFPFISWDKVIICAKKQMVKADVLVDDGFHNLIGGDYEKLLMSAPHNKHINEGLYNMIRVNTWREIYNIIHFMARSKVAIDK